MNANIEDIASQTSGLSFTSGERECLALLYRKHLKRALSVAFFSWIEFAEKEAEAELYDYYGELEKVRYRTFQEQKDSLASPLPPPPEI
jgi:hypothetical protein